MSFKVTVQENGRVVLPAAFRKALGLQKGKRHQLVLDVVEGRGVIETELDQVRDIQALFEHLQSEKSATEDLFEMRKADAQGEAQEEARP